MRKQSLPQFSPDTRCNSIEDLPQELHIYEDYDPPYVSQNPKPSQIRRDSKAQVNTLPLKSNFNHLKKGYSSQAQNQRVPLSGIGAASYDNFQSSLQFFANAENANRVGKVNQRYFTGNKNITQKSHNAKDNNSAIIRSGKEKSHLLSPNTPSITVTDLSEKNMLEIPVLESSPGLTRRKGLCSKEDEYVTLKVLRTVRESVIPGFIRTPTPERKFDGKGPFSVEMRAEKIERNKEKRENSVFNLKIDDVQHDLDKRRSMNSTAGSEDDVFVWSDSGEEEQNEEQEGGEEDIYETIEIVDEDEFLDKSHRVVNELMTTEEKYVGKLKLLLTAKKSTEEIIDEDTAKRMFPFIESICQLHENNILPDLKKRLKNWKNCQRIGDIMKKFAPFLKVYTDYVKNFDEAVKLVEQWNKKSVDFASLLRSLQSMNCEVSLLKIHMEAYMLEPIQRVPRYELLLRQYLKHLRDDSPDKPDVEDALNSVSEAALHFEDRMKRSSKMKKLIDIASQMDAPINIVHEARDLIKEGRINKINASTGRSIEHYVFLFSDMMIICRDQGFRVFQARYKVKVILDIEGMQIAEGENFEVPNSFIVKTKKKAVEFSAESREQKTEWQEKLWEAVGNYTRKKIDAARTRSLKLSDSESKPISTQLGKVAPIWVHNSQVTMCMLCARAFTAFRKKHHCRACGRVLCGPCSLHTARLEFDDWREHRVCDECYLALTDSAMKTVIAGTHFKARSGELSRHSGYVMISNDLTKTWYKRWIEIHEGGVLYAFKAQQDICPLHSISLATCDVHLCAHSNNPDVRLIKLAVDTKLYFIKEPDERKMKKWWQALKEAIEDTYGVYRRNNPKNAR